MKTISINMTHLLSSGNIKLDRLSFFRQLSDKITKDVYNGITFVCIKYTNEPLSISYNSSKPKFNSGYANFKGTKYKLNNKDLGMLTYIKANQKLVTRQKREYYIFTSFLKNYLFNARVYTIRFKLFNMVKETLIHFDSKEKFIRVYFLKDLALYAPDVL
jgi:hypothetical protein